MRKKREREGAYLPSNKSKMVKLVLWMKFQFPA